jgi:hypothetical protein
MRVPGKGTMTHIENREARPPHALLRTFLTQPFLLPVSDNSIGGRQVMVAWDSQSGASAATLVAYGTVRPRLSLRRAKTACPEPTPGNSFDRGSRKQ